MIVLICAGSSNATGVASLSLLLFVRFVVVVINLANQGERRHEAGCLYSVHSASLYLREVDAGAIIGGVDASAGEAFPSIVAAVLIKVFRNGGHLIRSNVDGGRREGNN